MADRTPEDIEKELKELHPKKELAYIDYTENAGSSSHREMFWNRYKNLQDRWNELVALRNGMLGIPTKEKKTVVVANPLLHACQMAYKKHHKGDDSIGWEELSDILLNALCESMGDDEFVKWNEQ